VQNILFYKLRISIKTIINTTKMSGLRNITTLTVLSSSTDREIVIWDRTSENSIKSKHSVTISTNGNLENINSVTLDQVTSKK
jgi:hypothetical protein